MNMKSKVLATVVSVMMVAQTASVAFAQNANGQGAQPPVINGATTVGADGVVTGASGTAFAGLTGETLLAALLAAGLIVGVAVAAGNGATSP